MLCLSSHIMPGLMLRPSTYHPIGSLDNNFRTAGLQNGPQFQGLEVPGTVGWGHIAARRYFALGPQPTDTSRKSAPRLLLIFHFPTFVIMCAESELQIHTCQWLQLQEENAIVTYICVRSSPASSKNGWGAYTKSSKLVFSSPPSCNSSSYRLFVRRNCRNLATILVLSFPPRPPQQSFYVPSQNEPPPPLRPITWLHSDFPAS